MKACKASREWWKGPDSIFSCHQKVTWTEPYGRFQLAARVRKMHQATRMNKHWNFVDQVCCATALFDRRLTMWNVNISHYSFQPLTQNNLKIIYYSLIRYNERGWLDFVQQSTNVITMADAVCVSGFCVQKPLISDWLRDCQVTHARAQGWHCTVQHVTIFSHWKRRFTLHVFSRLELWWKWIGFGRHRKWFC